MEDNALPERQWLEPLSLTCAVTNDGTSLDSVIELVKMEKVHSAIGDNFREAAFLLLLNPHLEAASLPTGPLLALLKGQVS